MTKKAMNAQGYIEDSRNFMTVVGAPISSFTFRHDLELDHQRFRLWRPASHKTPSHGHQCCTRSFCAPAVTKGHRQTCPSSCSCQQLARPSFRKHHTTVGPMQHSSCLDGLSFRVDTSCSAQHLSAGGVCLQAGPRSSGAQRARGVGWGHQLAGPLVSSGLHTVSRLAAVTAAPAAGARTQAAARLQHADALGNSHGAVSGTAHVHAHAAPLRSVPAVPATAVVGPLPTQGL